MRRSYRAMRSGSLPSPWASSWSSEANVRQPERLAESEQEEEQEHRPRPPTITSRASSGMPRMVRPASGQGEQTPTAQDAPHARDGPALVRLRRLLQAVQHAIDHGVEDRVVDPQAPVQIAAEELGEAAYHATAVEDARLQIVGRGGLAPAAQAVGNDAGVHRPGGAV